MTRDGMPVRAIGALEPPPPMRWHPTRQLVTCPLTGAQWVETYKLARDEGWCSACDERHPVADQPRSVAWNPEPRGA